MLELALRAILSLAFVVGLLWALARVSSRKMHGSSDSLVHVVTRQQLGRGSSLAVVNVGERTLVVGMTEHEVRLLAELDPAEIPVAQPVPGTRAATRPAGSRALRPAGSRALRPAGSRAGLRPALRAVQGRAGRQGHVPKHARTSPARPVAVTAPRVVEGRLAAEGSVESPGGALEGSVLSGQTWRQAFAAATRQVGNAS